MNLFRPSYHTEEDQSSPKSSPKGSPKSSPYLLNETQQAIVSLIDNDPTITQKAMAEQLNLTTRAIKKNIKSLTDNTVLKREGSSRKGIWIIL